MELTSLDLSVLMEEFSQLEDGFVQKVYQRGSELTLEIYVPGENKKRLILGPDRAFLSKYKRDNPERPPGFCMELRKHLGRIERIEQKGFDRVLEIESGDKTLIAEIFGKGNFILLDGEKIIGALREEEWADRTIRVGEKYVYPEPARDPREGELDLGEGELVRQLASALSLGGTYAEEICARLDIDKTRDVTELEEDELDKVHEAVESLLEDAENPEPVLYVDEEPVRAAPFHLKDYENHDREEFETFSRALDEYYYRLESKKQKKKQREAYEEQRQGLEKQLEQQQMKKKGLKRSSVENREKAETIYTEYQTLQKIQDAVNQSIEEKGWDDTREEIEDADQIKSLNKQENFASVDADGKSIKLYLDRDLEAIASMYYDKAKESESKIERVEEALERTREKLEELEPEDALEEVMEDKSEKRKKKWFEKYRWFYSSEGFLVIAGRDAQTNEMLVKKHMESNDLYFHANFDGAPSVVIKDGQDAGEKTREEAAKAAVTFSKTWKAGIGSDDVYYVNPEQVTENPESGEYLGKGAFVIRGDREYIRNVSVEAAVGPYEIDDEYVPMCGPIDSVKENCSDAVELEPGRKKKSDIAKKIQSAFKDYDLDLDYIIRALPPGKSDISS